MNILYIIPGSGNSFYCGNCLRDSKYVGAVRDLGVKRGPFYVLTGAMMPAILIEASFITHPVESKRLASARFHRQAAAAMAAGVERYLEGG